MGRERLRIPGAAELLSGADAGGTTERQRLGAGGHRGSPREGGLNMLQELTERRPDETSSSQDDDVNDDVKGYTEFKHGMY